MKTKILVKYLYFFGVVILGFILSLCVNTFYWADDYSFMMLTEERGILGNNIYGYNNWDGRFLALTSFIQGFLLKYTPIELATLVWSIVFLIGGYLSIKILNPDFKSLGDKNLKRLLITCCIIALWLGSYTHFSETIYWGTGGAYSLDLFFGASWCYFFYRLQYKKMNVSFYILFFIFSVITGASTQNLSIALITLSLITILSSYKNKTTFKYNILILLALLIGLIFICIAPGNWVRLESANPTMSNGIDVVELIKNPIKILIRYLKLSHLLIINALLIGFLSAVFKIKFKEQNRDSSFKLWFLKLNFFEQYKWLIAALATISPFILTPGLATPRTAIYFMFFIFIFVISKSNSIFTKLLVSLNIKVINTALTLTLIFLISNALFISYNLKQGFTLKKEVSMREDILKQSKHKTLKIKQIDSNLATPCYYFTDIPLKENEDNLNIWIRERYEKYFQIDKIIMEAKE